MERKRRKNTRVKKFTRKMQRSLQLVFCVLFLCLLFIGGRLIYINVKDGERYEKKVLSQQSVSVNANLPYKRGEILDRNGVVLAKSVKVYNVILDPSVVNTDKSYIKPTVDALVSVFGLSEQELYSMLTEKADSSYIRLLRQQSYEMKSAFDELASGSKVIKGVWFEEEYIRSYPFGSLASHAIGYTVAGDLGTWGIEQYYNSYLNGTNGREYGYYDAELNLIKVTREAVDGNTIVSTLDTTVQNIVEKKIVEFNDTWSNENIGVLVMNPNDGSILAMASNEGFDLNEPRNLSAYYTEEELNLMSDAEELAALNKMWRNFCISDTYEPGSTFKPFTIAAALEENLITPADTYVCNGYMMVGGWRISCNNHSGHGTITLAESLMKSCNPALMQIGEKLGKDFFYGYQEHFGFAARTGVDLPGESSSLLISLDKLNTTELATSSFGQSFNVTMIQLASAFCSLVNGGAYYQPHIVSEIRDASGATVYENDGILVNQSISAETSEFIKNALYMTVESGTAKPAQVEGYTIAGKTGTAQKGIRSEKKYVVSFIGCAPADNPEVVIYVVIDEVHDEEKKASSSLATELTSEILSEILPFLGIYPEGEIDYHVELPVIDPNTDLDQLDEGGTFGDNGPEDASVSSDISQENGTVPQQ